jgi:hypothetical protein
MGTYSDYYSKKLKDGETTTSHFGGLAKHSEGIYTGDIAKEDGEIWYLVLTPSGDVFETTDEPGAVVLDLTNAKRFHGTYKQMDEHFNY